MDFFPSLLLQLPVIITGLDPIDLITIFSCKFIPQIDSICPSPIMYKNRIFNSVIHRFLDSANITKTFQQFILHIAFIRRRLEIPIIKIQIKAIITNVTYRLI